MAPSLRLPDSPARVRLLSRSFLLAIGRIFPHTPGMDVASMLVRRATVDDLPQLIQMWQQEHLPWQELEKRVTEFQVAEDGTGTVFGAVGLRMTGHEGHIHSEIFRQWELADSLRGRFWERLDTLARNHALVRLWTQLSAPFWHGYGFQPPTVEILQKFPPVFGDHTGAWTVLTLRAEPAPMDLDKEFMLFKEAEQARTEKAFEQARLLRKIAIILAVLLFVGVVIGMTYLVVKSQAPPPSGRHG